MAKEVAISKRIKISEAQQYMILAVLGASVFLGASVSLVSHFIQQISFNTEVIMAEEASIAMYSDVIQKTGVCKKPNGSIYSDDELNRCNPDSIEASEVPNTLRSDILESMSANAALNSVPKEDNFNCTNPTTDAPYTYKELSENYKNARGPEQLQEASNRIKSCSALRVVPDALPAFKNEEALLASLNKLFIASNWEPESFGSGGITEVVAPGLNSISVNLSVEANTDTTMSVLSNIERSIREFDIKRAVIEWESDNKLSLQAQATAYYMDSSKLKETEKTIKPTEGKK